MKLFGSYTSPFVRHCRIALAQCGMEFEMTETDGAMSAELSPTSKVPFLQGDGISLTDSSSIIRYAREYAGQDFLPTVQAYDTYLLANTVLDASINLFLIEKDGFGPDRIPYLGRQRDRVHSGLAELENRIDQALALESDAEMRCACFVDWAMFRDRIDFQDYPGLIALLEAANTDSVFTSTAPAR